MARHGQHIDHNDPLSVAVVLQLLTTKGIGERTVDRIITDVLARGEELATLLELSSEELVLRYRIKRDVAEAFQKSSDLADRLSRELRERGITVLLKGSSSYPIHLTNALGHRAPPVLFVMGNLDLLRMRAVGFCGSRKASEKGLSVAAECARILAMKGINVVSGYAHGVDLTAHRSALEAGGVTTFVLAEGILGFKAKSEVKNLLNGENYLVVSTYSPRLPWSARQAMARNRIICGLSNAMIVIESGNKGGTFEAGKAALELRRPLFVVDYAQPAPSASGNRYFIERGAKPLRRNRSGQANLDGVLKAVEQQQENGNGPMPDSQSLFSMIPKSKTDKTKEEMGTGPKRTMLPTEDRRLIEDYLPVKSVGEAASSEPRTKGHISTMHVWRARRPLVACRAAVYGALVPAEQFRPKNGPEEKRDSLMRANVAKFVERLCKYPGNPSVIKEAQRHILEAHAERLSRETGKKVMAEDIEEGRAPRPKVLDMFAGGGAIPLEAARLGCEAYALELNPVAHVIELCTVAFPQQFGSDLADDVERWGNLILARTREAVSDVLARIPIRGRETRPVQRTLGQEHELHQHSEEYSVVAYYWTRTIPCPNPQCKGTVPLYRQTWLRKKSSGYVALKPVPDMAKRIVRFRVVESPTEAGLGFDPSQGSTGSSTVCPFCQTTLDGPYVREYGEKHGFGHQLMCVIALNSDGPGKVYLVDESLADSEAQYQAIAEQRATEIEGELGLSSLDEEIPPTGNAGLATGKSYLYGIRTFRQAFTPRQRYILLTMAREVRRAHQEMRDQGLDRELAKAITTYLGLWLSRLTDRCNGLARWNNARETIESLTSMKRFAMTWDFPEVNIFGGGSGDALNQLAFITATVRREGQFRNPAKVLRGSATELPYDNGTFDAVITDPPYYDNESYSELSDVCYVWLRPTIGFLYPEHFAGQLTPKKKECVAAAYRQGGKQKARACYEEMLFQSLKEAHRVTKPGGILVVVYAHKTTLGWATLVDALRRAGYEVAEAWPLATETKARVAHQGDAALASSIFLVARKREETEIGSYEEEVRPELEQIVRERVDTLWKMGITGADLVIAAVGAGLRAFTRFARVEYANGEEVPAEKFLAEVEGVVLETLLEKIFGVAGSGVAAVDGPSRFYVLWRYTYKAAEMDAGEAIVFTYGQNVELDGPNGLSTGSRALVEKKKGKYRLRDFTERGDNEKLGLPADDGTPAPLIDALHRILWLIENEPRNLNRFLDEARPDRERLRLVAQALAGTALEGKKEEAKLIVMSTSAEHSALNKLLANWGTLIERHLSDVDLKTKQMRFHY